MKSTVLGIDLAKNVFQLHEGDTQGNVGIRKKLARPQLLPCVAQLAPCRIGLEASQGAHIWSVQCGSWGMMSASSARSSSRHTAQATRTIPMMPQ
jgi:transposase